MRTYPESTALEVATKQHVAFAFETLISHLRKQSEVPQPDFPDAWTALFVTWKTSPRRGGGHAKLRGCIGILEPRQLHKALRDYTLTSALHDKRFDPIQLSEVSLLSCFETAGDWTDWVIGQHGLIIEFTDPDLHCKRSATFLPEVAEEQGWSQQECIDALIRKAGYAGPVTAVTRSGLQLVRYQSTTCTLTYAQFMQERERQGDIGMAAAVTCVSA